MALAPSQSVAYRTDAMRAVGERSLRWLDSSKNSASSRAIGGRTMQFALQIKQAMFAAR
jgi:hypothetical protein